MDKEKLLSAIGNIDDDLIERAEKAGRSKSPVKIWIQWGAAAACLLIAVTAVFMLGRGKDNLASKQDNAAPRELAPAAAPAPSPAAAEPAYDSFAESPAESDAAAESASEDAPLMMMIMPEAEPEAVADEPAEEPAKTAAEEPNDGLEANGWEASVTGASDAEAPAEEAPAGETGASANALITSESIGGIWLGMSEPELLELYGQPDYVPGGTSTVDAGGSIHMSYRYYDGDFGGDSGFMVEIVDDGTEKFVNYIYVYPEGELRLDNGIGIGSDASLVEEIYGVQPDLTESVGESEGAALIEVCRYTVGTPGQALEIYTENGVVSIIELGRLVP